MSVFETPLINSHIRDIVVGDFDGDGRMEFVAAADGELIIYENDGDNSYHQTFRTSINRINGTFRLARI